MNDISLWRRSLQRIRNELVEMSTDERLWLKENLLQIQQLQRRIHRFFESVDGDRHCAVCHGACCEKGRHHLTLVNLLGFLIVEEEPPTPDFSATCPFLGAQGCRLDIGRRPFNCVTFNCDTIENALDEAGRTSFYQLEAELRRRYEHFDQRYAGSSLRGLLIRAESLGEGSFLQRV